MNVQVFVPAQGGSALGTPGPGTTLFPQSSVTVGGVGIVALAGHATVEEPGGGKVNAEAVTVYVYIQLYVVPLQAVYVNVQVFVPPLQGGSAPGTPADTVNVLPQLSITVGGVGSTASAAQATVDEPPGGKVTTGGLTV